MIFGVGCCFIATIFTDNIQFLFRLVHRVWLDHLVFYDCKVLIYLEHRPPYFFSQLGYVSNTLLCSFVHFSGVVLEFLKLKLLVELKHQNGVSTCLCSHVPFL